MEYGGQDREFGERLMNKGIKGIQIRYSAICVHLQHGRGYMNNTALKLNKEIRTSTKKNKATTTNFGIKSIN
jgi:hypothetical protein